MHLNLKMGSKFYFLVFFILVLSSVSGQIIAIDFLDRKTNDVIPNVRVELTGDKLNSSDSIIEFVSTAEGQITFNLKNYLGSKSFSITCIHPLYETQTQQLKFKEQGDSIRLEISLYQKKVRELRQVVVKAPGIPDTVFSSDRLSVADFEIQKNGELVLLTYPKQLHNGSEVLLFDGKVIKSSFEVPGEAKYLIRDYRGNSHVVCTDKILGIQVSESSIGLGQIPQDYFFKYILPIVDSNTSKLYFTNFNKDYPAFDYFVFDTFDSVFRSIMHIKDDLMMELYRSEYKWVDVRTKLWAKNKERETGIDAQIWVGANYFTQSLYYKEPYAPFFQRNDSLFVFDYPKDRLVIFNFLGQSLDTIPLLHHYFKKKTGWQNKLIQDYVTGSIYGLFEKEGYLYLGLVDVKSGEITDRVKIYHKYAEKIKIHNNRVYYIYRPFESTQKRYLYSQKMPFTFQKMMRK